MSKLLERQSSEDVADRSIYILSECSWGDFDISTQKVISAHFTEESAMKEANTRGLPVSPPEDDSNWCEIKKVELVS